MWLAWVDSQLHIIVTNTAQHNPSKLFQIIKPKRILAKAQGQTRRSLPGMVRTDGTLCHDDHQVALPWQVQFNAVEHADATTMEDLYTHSRPVAQPLPGAALQEMPTLFDLEQALQGLATSKAPGVNGLGPELFR